MKARRDSQLEIKKLVSLGYSVWLTPGEVKKYEIELGEKYMGNVFPF